MSSIGLLKHTLSTLMTQSLFTEKPYALLFCFSIVFALLPVTIQFRGVPAIKNSHH
jgi:hypothetical protein